MRKFLKGEKLPAWRLNELVETLELLQEKVTELEAKLQSAAGASASGDRSGAAGGATGAPRARMYKAKGQRPEVVRHLWEPFFLDHRNGLVAPGSPGWYVRKAADMPPELLDVQPTEGMSVWLKTPNEYAEGCSVGESDRSVRELVFLPRGNEVPRDLLCSCAGYGHVYLGSFGADCRYKNVTIEGFDDRRKMTFYRAAAQLGRLADISCTGEGWDSINYSEEPERGEMPVTLRAEGYEVPAGAMYLRRLKPVGATRIRAGAEQLRVSSGVDLLPEDSACTSREADERGLPQMDCARDVVPECLFCVTPEWRKLASLNVGTTAVGLYGYPLHPGRWALRFAPGTLPGTVPTAVGAQWLRYTPDASAGQGVPAPGDEICGAYWQELAATCNVLRGGWGAVTGTQYSSRTLIAPGKNAETGCAWVWFVEEESSYCQGWRVKG
ncbi:MAG: hypothetical protein IJN29_06725 [Akkermansia sp.]|nr:hypothetical protein [Akkermansia sp.]